MTGPPTACGGLFIGAQINYGLPNAEDKQSIDWLHIDLAKPAWKNERSTGYGIPLICSLLSEHIDANVIKP